MENSNTAAAPSGSTRPSSSGLVFVGVIAVGAFAISTYSVFTAKPSRVSPESGDTRLADSASPLAARIDALERRLVALEQRPSPGAASADPAPASAAPEVGAARPPDGETAPAGPVQEDSTHAVFDITPNAELKGRLGRLIVEFPQANDLKARTESFKAGGAKGLRTDFGNVAVEMTAGDYDLNISGATVTGVTIKSGHDTRMQVGVLRLNATSNTRFEIFQPGGTKGLGVYFGQNDVGLPVGTYEVDVNGQRERVTIDRDRIAEF